MARGPRKRACALRRADFLRVTRLGRRVATRWFLVFVAPRDEGGQARLGITVTRRVGKAVRRNRIKRLVREWFREHSRGMGGCDVVVIAKRDLPANLGLREVERDLAVSLER
jgi:ribonuclease P protein component